MIGHRWFWAMLVIVVLAGGSPATGQMCPLEDETLANTYAGATLAVWGPDVDLGMGFDSLVYTDPGGTGDGRPGCLSLEGFALVGRMGMQTPLSMDMGGFVSLISGIPQTGIDLTLDAFTLSIDRLAIDAIRVGYGPGSGESFGAITLTHWVTQISGRIQVYSY